MQLAMHRRV